MKIDCIKKSRYETSRLQTNEEKKEMWKRPSRERNDKGKGGMRCAVSMHVSSGGHAGADAMMTLNIGRS